MPAPQTVCTIEKRLGAESWVNVYHLAPAIGSAASAAADILAAERAVTCSNVLFTKMSLRTVVEDDEVYTTSPINLFGLYGGGTNIPLFNVVRVDFQASTGRPSRKYLRGLLNRDDLGITALNGDTVTRVQTNYAAVVAAIADFVDVDGDDILAGAVWPDVGIRQLRRGSKKKPTPSSPTPV